MTRLRVDPWDPEYGGSVEIEDDLGEPDVQLDIEPGPWGPRDPAPIAEKVACAFVDGVRRIDARLFAEDGAVSAPALAGSWAVGAAWAPMGPRVDSIRVGRALVVGGGMDYPTLVAAVGQERVEYPCSGVAGVSPTDPIQGLQNLMREDEAALAKSLASSGEMDLLVLDGPLTYFAGDAPVVGLIKRQSRAYLPQDRAGILAALGSGQRTPLFLIRHQRLERYAWYTRIAEGRAIDGAMTGIVRMEVATAVGMEGASELADRAASILPAFASRIGRDPRAPQNLYPVGRLESVLRHRLGDATLLRRALEAAIWSQNAGA